MTSAIDPATGIRRSRINTFTRLAEAWSGRLPNDSNELTELRRSLTASDHRFANERMTPTRLGIYAGEMNITIIDYGAHSRRWITYFKDGYIVGCEVRSRQPHDTVKHSRPLKVLNHD